jgi:magnesium-transporting ATPase (P-type)
MGRAAAINAAEQPGRRGTVNSVTEPRMTIRTRKLIGTIVIMVILMIYALLALAVAIVLQVNHASKLAELAYYAVAGLLWIVPAGLVIRWMGRPDKPEHRA